MSDSKKHEKGDTDPALLQTVSQACDAAAKASMAAEKAFQLVSSGAVTPSGTGVRVEVPRPFPLTPEQRKTVEAFDAMRLRLRGYSVREADVRDALQQTSTNLVAILTTETKRPPDWVTQREPKKRP